MARAVAASEIPVISAVGHETDFTICDFAADLRAPTPSAAAEIAVPDITALGELLGSFSRRMNSAVGGTLTHEKARLEARSQLLKRLSPRNYIDDLAARCGGAGVRIDSAVRHSMEVRRGEIAALCARLDALSPLRVIARGYAVASSGGKVLTSPSQVEVGDTIDLRLAGGELKCEVID